MYLVGLVGNQFKREFDREPIISILYDIDISIYIGYRLSLSLFAFRSVFLVV